MATIDDFRKLDLRVGVVRAAALHENAERLLVLQVEMGTETRQVVAGIRAAYQPEQLVGRRVVLVANLDPAVIRGVQSQGMILAAQDDQDLTLATFDRPVTSGSQVK